MQQMDMTLSVSRSIACVVANLLERGEAGAEQEVDGQDAAIFHSIIIAPGMDCLGQMWLVIVKETSSTTSGQLN